jgi:glycosyltransferase involved in cell wall biosynthesis
MHSPAPRRICLITPGHLSTNPRIVKEADALSGAGYDVTVIAADYMQWAREADAEFGGRRWQVAPKVRFGPQAPRPIHFKQALTRRSARMLTKAVGLRQFLVERAIHPAVPALVRAALSVRADLYIAHYTAALPAAARAARKFGSCYAFDAEDYHLGELPDGEAHEFERSLIRAIEQRYLPGCAYMTAASPGIADAYVETYGVRRPTVVLNVFPRANAPKAPTGAGNTRPGPSLYWFSQTIGPNRGLEIAVEAMSLSAARPHLYLRGNLAAGYAAHLGAIATKFGVGDRIHLLEPAAPSAMESLAADYDLGLVSELEQTPNRKIALVNKLFSFFLAGVPAVISAIPAHRRLEEVEGAAFLYEPEDPVGLARELDALLLNPERLAEARNRAWSVGQRRYNWDIEKRILLSAVTQSERAQAFRAH